VGWRSCTPAFEATRRVVAVPDTPLVALRKSMELPPAAEGP
jgi:hypothetical protein